jgi:hypothetical protein
MMHGQKNIKSLKTSQTAMNIKLKNKIKKYLKKYIENSVQVEVKLKKYLFFGI